MTVSRTAVYAASAGSIANGTPSQPTTSRPASRECEERRHRAPTGRRRAARLTAHRPSVSEDREVAPEQQEVGVVAVQRRIRGGRRARCARGTGSGRAAARRRASRAVATASSSDVRSASLSIIARSRRPRSRGSPRRRSAASKRRAEARIAAASSGRVERRCAAARSWRPRRRSAVCSSNRKPVEPSATISSDAATREGDRRSTGGLDLGCGHAEVLDPGHDQAGGASHRGADLDVRQAAEEPDRRSGCRAEPALLGALADHVEPEPGPIGGLDGKVDPLVALQSRHDEEAAAALRCRREARRSRSAAGRRARRGRRSGRIRSAVKALLARKMSTRRAAAASARRSGTQGRREGSAREPAVAEVLVRFPQEARRRVAVRDVDRVAGWPDVQRECRRARDDDPRSRRERQCRHRARQERRHGAQRQSRIQERLEARRPDGAAGEGGRASGVVTDVKTGASGKSDAMRSATRSAPPRCVK